MEIIKSFESMLNHLVQQGKRNRVAVVWAADYNSQVSVQRALEAGFIDAIFVGCQKEVEKNEDVMRFADHVFFEDATDADHAARREMFKLHMKGRPASEDIDYDRLADLTDKYISSDIAYIVNDAAMTAAFLGEPVTMQRLVDAVGATRSSLTQSTISEYENLRSRLEGISRQNDSERRRVGFV